VTDFGVQVGVTLPQFTSDPGAFTDVARRAEHFGFDSLWVFDHLWPLSGKGRPVLEGWTALAWLAAMTSRVRVGSLVTRSSLRHPALLAKMAATVAEIAPGRLTVAIGSGDELSRAENEAFGLPYFSGPRRIRQLVSTVEVVTHYLHEELVEVEDEFVAVRDLAPSPRPDPPSVWVGGRSPEVVEVAGRLAQGWNGWGGTSEDLALDVQKINKAAAGRPLEISWGGTVLVTDGGQDVTETLSTRDRAEAIWGSESEVTDQLSRRVDAGAKHLILTPMRPSHDRVYERLARIADDLRNRSSRMQS
jgi:alkanesulfonate monooxygenase SsuD/methylene tetrahydromethanopterin reductase-like flavin-dependent oxidoreductase (luciferase family)